MKEKIRRYLAPLRRKMGLQKILEIGMLQLVIVSALLLTISACTKFIYLPAYGDYIRGIAVLFLIAFPIHALLCFPNPSEAIRTADALYFKERLVTSLEYDGRSGQAIEEQREDTLNRMREIRIERLYKLRFPRRLAAIFCVLFACHLGLFFLETESAKKNAEARHEKKELTESLEKLREKLAEKRQEKGADQGLEKKLAETLEGKLRGVESREDALKALSMAKNELSELFSEEEKQRVAESLKEIDKSARELAGGTLSDYAFQDETDEEAKEREGDAGTPEGRADASEAPGAGEDSSGSAEGAIGAGEQGNSGESGNAENSGTSGKSGDSNRAKNPGNSGEKGAGGESGKSSGEGEQTPGEPEGDGAGAEGDGESRNQQAGAQQGSGNGENGESGGQSGAAQGGQNSPGSGKDGTGAGSGGKGRGRGAGKNEIMIDPERLQSQEKNRFVPSQKAGENEDSSYRRAKTVPKDRGEVKDYRKRLAEYAEEASFTGRELKIPNAMQGLVKSYFDSIQD